MFHLRLLALLALALMPLAARAQDGWFLFRGNPQRTGAASSMAAWPKRPAWQRPLLSDKIEGLDPDEDQRVKDLIDRWHKDADPTTLPGFFPLIVNEMCIYRSHRGVCAVTLEGLEMKDDLFGQIQKFKPSDIVWKSIPMPASLAEVSDHHRVAMDNVVVPLLRANQQDVWLWANPMIGSLSTDGIEIFAIDDIALPSTDAFKPVAKAVELRDLKPLSLANEMQAYSALTGKLNWDTDRIGRYKRVLTQTRSLGAPLPIGGKAYALNESAEELRLLALKTGPTEKGEAKLESTLALTKVPAAEQILKSPLRRTQPLHIAEANGLLVCPTNLGVMIGVDRAKMAVRWQYRYRDEKTAPPDLPHFQAAGPIVHKDRIVFTAADVPEIHCLDLDGKKQWTAAADKDLYLATVHDNLVLLVGKTHCRALNLADGKEKWKLEMGLPAGVGVLDGSLYYLPLKRDAATKQPTLWAIDLAKGKKAHQISVTYPDALGNLALHRGMFVSQSVTFVAAFPLSVKIP